MKKTSIYIKDVINEERLHFFKFPKFGSFFASKFKLKQYDVETCIFDLLKFLKNNFYESIEKIKIYTNDPQSVESNLNYIKEESQSNYYSSDGNGSSQNNTNSMNWGSKNQTNSIKENDLMKNDIKSCQQCLSEIIYKNIKPVKTLYVLSMDTLGSDSLIEKEKQILTYKFLRIFEMKWNQNSKQQVIIISSLIKQSKCSQQYYQMIPEKKQKS